MPDLLIRNLTEDVVASLKEKASDNNRSLQAELKAMLVREADLHEKRKGLSDKLREIRSAVAEDIEPYSTDSAAEIRKLRGEI